MASTTAEVMLYYGIDTPEFEKSVNSIRFSKDPELSFREIVKIISPIYDAAYDKGWDRG